MGPSRDRFGKPRRSVHEAGEGTKYGGTEGFSLGMGSEGRPSASSGRTNLGFLRIFTPAVLGRVLGWVLHLWEGLIALEQWFLRWPWVARVPGSPLGGPGTRPNQSLHPWYFLTGRHETRCGPVFFVSSRFYGLLGVGPGVQKLLPFYLIGFWAIFAPMGLLTFWTLFGTRVWVGGSSRVSLESSFEGLSNGDENLGLSQLGTKL
jgi:hypothetical protein